MIRYLTQSDFKTMPWANGKGVTVELARVDDAQGMLWRLSRAAVVEDGDFSIFPGIDRNLTVIEGPGFDLAGSGFTLRADPLRPVAFPGDVALGATGVGEPCEDFNVMVRRGAMRADVAPAHGGKVQGGLTAIFALGAMKVVGQRIGRHDLVLTDEPADFTGPALVVHLSAA